MIVIHVSTMQCHVEIRIFYAKCKVKFSKVKLTSQKANCTLSFCSLAILFVFVLLMLLVCGDTELSPGPRKRDTCHNLSIFHWNSNSIDVHNFEKVIFLEAYTQSTDLIKFAYQQFILIPLYYMIVII